MQQAPVSGAEDLELAGENLLAGGVWGNGEVVRLRRMMARGTFA